MWDDVWFKWMHYDEVAYHYCQSVCDTECKRSMRIDNTLVGSDKLTTVYLHYLNFKLNNL